VRVDHVDEHLHLGSPPMSLADALVELQELTERLRRECPWDREQTARTIVPHTVEEAYEVAHAALAENDEKLLDKSKNDAITKWTDGVKKYFEKKVTYATGYAPPATATNATTTG